MRTVSRLETVTLELTSRCNLKCSYCAIPRSFHKPVDLEIEDWDKLVLGLKRLGVVTVQISGGGETTILKNWAHYLQRLADEGFRLTIQSNLSRTYSESDLRALSCCAQIGTSCDTPNPDLFAVLRKGSDLKKVLFNMMRIRASSIAEGRQPPQFLWNCVANDRSIHDVVGWVSLGLAVGVDHFQLSELVVMPEGGPDEPKPIGTLPPEEIAKLRGIVEQARQLAESHGKEFTVVPAVKQVLDGAQQALGITLDGQVSTIAAIPQGQTRDCLLPWMEMYVWATGAVGPCCLQPGPVADPIEAANGAFMQKTREELLTGRLSGACTWCPIRPLVPVEQLRAAVEALPNTMPPPPPPSSAPESKWSRLGQRARIALQQARRSAAQLRAE